MTRLSLFNSPLLLGFEQFERTLDRVAKASADGYPPYNIEQVGADQLRITLAVAGFTDADLSVQIEDNQLVIRGKQSDDGERIFLHRGIAARQFQRSFVLADGIEVVGASLDNGLLSVDLQRPMPANRIRTISIERPTDTATTLLSDIGDGVTDSGTKRRRRAPGNGQVVLTDAGADSSDNSD